MASLYDSPSAIKHFLTQRDLGARKRWGQNFLINPEVRQRLVEALAPVLTTEVWEIGPGLGAMTELLLDQGLRVIAFEIDPAYCQILTERFSGRSLQLVIGDVLRTWPQEAVHGWRPILGNLPYNIAGSLLGDWAEEGASFPVGVFLVQKELADRMGAAVGTSEYSSFSVLCQSVYDIESLFTVGPGNFFPRPEVNSVALRIRPKAVDLPQRRSYSDFLKLCFHSRRQTLRNNLARCGRLGWSVEGVAQHFRSLGVNLQHRAEELSVSDYVGIWSHPMRENYFNSKNT